MSERDYVHRQAAREVRRAVAALDMTWQEWRNASESGRYYVFVKGLPCARAAGCRHVVAWLMGKN